MAKRPVEKYDFKAFGEAIKAARTGRKESRKQVSDEMYISPRYLANIENKGQHPSLQIFFELMLRYNISVDQFLLDTPTQKDTKRRQLDALLDDMSDNGIRIVTATAKEISEVEITKEVIYLIHNKTKSFRQIVNSIDVLEKVAQANGFTQIDENIAKEVLCG